ncbi:uncharacterized protein LOC118276956 [Spodoptera frugiperda]|uniref:Uncharacterized protein LOC118276956 n=1 Tax=Spodoptera frugiperda TaxID=7108 RepID=A0A9R0F050_SPOFR|nr:uncharacterized protein LOC118276956 [Spodoptera frugiperda]
MRWIILFPLALVAVQALSKDHEDVSKEDQFVTLNDNDGQSYNELMDQVIQLAAKYGGTGHVQINYHPPFEEKKTPMALYETKLTSTTTYLGRLHFNYVGGDIHQGHRHGNKNKNKPGKSKTKKEKVKVLDKVS